MMNHPEVQRKAQAELDTVLGGRLPTCDDRGPSLPYINALVEEVLRWSAVVPLCEFSQTPSLFLPMSP